MTIRDEESFGGFKFTPAGLRSFLELNPFPFFVIREGVIVAVNAQFRETTGFSTDEITGKQIEDILHFTDPQAMYQYHREKLRKRDKTFEHRCGIRSKDGSIVSVVLTMNLVIAEGVCIGAFQNISKEVQLQEELTHKNQVLVANTSALEAANADLQGAFKEISKLARTDPLTGLLNRRAFNNRFEEEIERLNRYGHPLAVAMFDLDHFKRVNDTYGHSEGDRALIRFSEIMVSIARSNDLLARLGGEEFIAVLANSAPSGAQTFADRVRLSQQDTGLYTTVSIGICVAPEHGNDRHTLMRIADKALYTAKHEGRNQAIMASRVNPP